MLNFRELAFLLYLVSVPAFSADDVVDRARQQLESGNCQEAYELLAPLEPARSGDPVFDYYLGSSALALGKNTEAVFALERVLAVDPNNVPARAQIARAYFNLKETETARLEFESVRKQGVTPEVSETIDRFLDAIGRIEESSRTVWRGYLEIGIGYDTNVSSATDDEQVAVPQFGGAVTTLDTLSREQDDGFAHVGAGVSVQHPFTERLFLFGGLDYQRRINFDQHTFSHSSYDANLGLSYRRDRDRYTFTLLHSQFWVNDPTYHDAYREIAGATLQWQHDFDARNQINTFVQFSALRYPVQPVFDADRTVAGMAYAHAFGRGAVIAYLGAYGGEEKAESVPQLGHRLTGIRIGAQWNLRQNIALFSSASAEQREYPGIDTSFLVERKDTQASVSAGLLYSPRKGMRITPQISWTHNRSNIPVSAFDRGTFQITYRYDM
ncbi:MAG: surface lipoprotein assembly modifier [Burkholderiales bacterium]